MTEGMAGLACYCTHVDDGIGGVITLPGECPRHDAEQAIRRLLPDLYGSGDDPHTPSMPDVWSALRAAYMAGLAAAPPVSLDRESLRVAILSARWPNGDRIYGLGATVADLIVAALAPLLGGGGS